MSLNPKAVVVADPATGDEIHTFATVVHYTVDIETGLDTDVHAVPDGCGESCRMNRGK